MDPQQSITEASLEMMEIDDLLDAMTEINPLDSAHTNDEVDDNPFETIIQNEMQNIYKDEIEKTTQIIINSSIDGSVIKSNGNNQHQLEEFLNTHFAEIWLHKKQHCSKIARNIIQNVDNIQRYSVKEMVNFIAYFEIRETVKITSDSVWNQHKFKTASRKEWNVFTAKHQIPKGISIKIWKAIQKSENTSKHVAFDDENKLNEEEKTIIMHPSMSPKSGEKHTFSNFNDWNYDTQELKLPTYISKALYYLSEDDVLELLMDRAVSKVLSFDDLWRDETFCEELYNDTKFKHAVDRVYERMHINEDNAYDFIDDFIEKEKQREIAHYQRDVDRNKKDEDMKRMDDGEESKYDDNDVMKLKQSLEVQLSQSNMEIKCEFMVTKQYKITILQSAFDEEWDWALFRRKTLKNVYMQNLKTSGYWKILTRSIDEFVEDDTGVVDQEAEEKQTGGFDIYTTELEHSMAIADDNAPILRDLTHLNAILMFLQSMDTQHLHQMDKDNIEFVAQDLKPKDSKALKVLKPVIRVVFDPDETEEKEEEEEEKERKLIDDEETAELRANKDKDKEETKTEDPWYDIYWWNSSKDDREVHALAMKHHASKGKMEYFLRFIMPSSNTKENKSRSITKSKSLYAQRSSLETQNSTVTEKQEILEWVWYDNDKAYYKAYELGNNVTKQLEASFHSNCSTIFPKPLNCNFNYLMMKEMTAELKKRGRNVGLGYVLRFAYSNSERAQIVNMEQLSVWKNAPQFARNVQRRINGKNSIYDFFSSNDSEYVNEWKKVYLLYTENQKKFFWSHVLAVCAATHYISVEIRNQVIAFNYSENMAPQTKNEVFSELNDLEIHHEQRSYIHYPGFLVAPVTKTHEIHAPFMSTFQYLTNNARAVVLQKFNTNINYDKRSGDLPKQYCIHSTQWKWRNAQQQFYCDECASLLQFAEIVRKFILEYEHPEVRRFLWPWYRNTFHHNDFIKYHDYVSKYNLSTLYAQSDILQMRGDRINSELQFDNCGRNIKMFFEHCGNCCPSDSEHNALNHEELTNIRYRRKFAGRFLLGGWNIARNLNIIRQQLKIIFTQLDTENNERIQQQILFQFFSQQNNNQKERPNISGHPRKVTMHEKKDSVFKSWIDEISDINNGISDHYHYDCTSMELETESQIIYFCKFVHLCLESAKDLLNNNDDELYYKHFLDSWLRTPIWYTEQHDIILLRLALTHNLNEKQFVSELNGMNTADYQQVLSSLDYYDRDKPFHEFSAWCQRWENIFHRLRYITHCIVLQLSACSPSIIDKRIPNVTDRSFGLDRKLNSIIFLDDIMYQTHLKYCQDERQSLKRDRDSDFSHYPYGQLPVPRGRDPFIVRSLDYEFKELLYAFDLYKHGKIMAQFIINRLEMKHRKALWELLGTLLKRMPYHMSLQILTKHRDLLRRGVPKLLDEVCEQVIDGTNFSVPVALHLSSLMNICSEEDLARYSEWDALSHKYEQLAAQQINTVESDHIISILLDARIFMDDEGLLELALQSRRTLFLNSETINGVITHMWHTVDFSNPHSNPSFKKSETMGVWQLFQLLLFKPFYFYLSPVGFSWTIGVLFIFYCIVIGIYLNLGLHQTDTFPDISSWKGIFEITVWVCGFGYIAQEVKEYFEQGESYYKVSLNNNIWDIVLSLQFFILFVLRLLGGCFSIHNTATQTVYDVLWAIQCVVLAIRALRLFQTSTFLGPLLHVVGLMVGALIKFLIILVVTFAGFVIGLQYIASGDDEEILDIGSINQSSSFLFELAVGITDLSSIDQLSSNHLIAQIYVGLFIIVSSILLLNLLIALMTTEFEAVREKARSESAYLKAQACYDLQQRSRYIPPPLSWVLFVLVVAIHFINFIPAILSPVYLNIYSHLHKKWMNPLRSICYRYRKHPHDRCKQESRNRRDHNELIDKQQFEVWDETNESVMNTRCRVLDYYWKSIFGAWAAPSCCCCRNNPITNWKIFHVNCYNIISDGSNDIQKWNVMSITEYFDVYEHCTQSTLDDYDKNLVTHLTSSSCVFCKYCSRSITTSPKHITSQLVTPFWVLADFISVWCFLILLYFPMLVLLFVIGAIEQVLIGSMNDNHIMSFDEEEDDIVIQQLSQRMEEPNARRYNQSRTLDASLFKSLNAKKKRKLRDYGKQYYRKTATRLKFG